MPRPQGQGHRRAVTPLVILALICAWSLAARTAWLSEPCQAPCGAPSAHLLVFDENYYVNAARVIAGVRPPAGAPYAGAPLGDDPNAEHPQLAKLAMAGMIELLGDGPLAWRLPSLILGTACLIGLYALVRAAGGSRELGLGVTALMAADNLLLVHGRIATLDIYVLAGMLWATVAYVRDHPLIAGALIGVAACTKMVGPYVLAVLALLELFGAARTREAARRRLARPLACAVVAAAVLVGLLGLLDVVAPPYDNAAARPVRGGALAHLGHMFSYAAHQTSPHGPQGIASYPWQWLYDSRPITYLNIEPAHPAAGLEHVRPAVHFLGVISPPILLGGLLGLLMGAVALARSQLRRRRGRGYRESDATLPPLWALALAWFLGTFLPFEALSLIWSRTSYLYYMVIVMPGLYLAAALLAARLARYRWLVAAWASTVVVALVLMYPFTPLP